MLEQIRYRLLMRRLRGEIAQLVNENGSAKKAGAEKAKRAVLTACKACGSIV